MITISGKDITRENSEFPTLYDIGYSLSRVPRFNGYTTEFWSVLHHLFACADYAQGKKYGPRTVLFAGIHDAHEAVTSDICPPWKTADTKALQGELDSRLYQSLHIGPPDGWTERILRTIDHQMVYAEARAFAPQVAEHILKPGPNYRDSIDVLDSVADESVRFAKGFLAPYITDANACGILYREFVTHAIRALQSEVAHADS